MILYEYLLKFYGLRKLLIKASNNIDDDGNEMKEIIITIDDDGEIKQNIVKKPKTIYEKKITRFIINYTYRVFVGLLLLFECVHPIVSSGITKDIHYFTTSFFSYMFLFQFIFGICLHDNEFYNAFLQKVNKYNVYIHIMYTIALFVSLILSTVPLFTTNYTMQLYNLTNATNGYVPLTVYAVVNRFYSYNIFFSNIIIFTLLMWIHCEEIKSYKKSLELMIDDNLMDMNISSTIREYTEIKENYSDSVKNSNHIFASIVVFGLIGCYFTLIFIPTGYNSVYSYIDAGCSIIVLFIYIGTICVITGTVNGIKSLIDSIKFISIFLSRSNFALVHGDIYNDYAKEELLNIHKPNKEILKGSISPRTFTKSNDSSQFKNSNAIPSVMNLKSKSTLNLIPDLKLNGKCVNSKTIIDTVEQMQNSDDTNKKIDFIKNISFRTMVTATENGISMDWIILDKKLSDPWERFVVCGFEINDSQLFQQLLAMALSFLGLLGISKIFF